MIEWRAPILPAVAQPLVVGRMTAILSGRGRGGGYLCNGGHDIHIKR